MTRKYNIGNKIMSYGMQVNACHIPQGLYKYNCGDTGLDNVLPETCIWGLNYITVQLSSLYLAMINNSLPTMLGPMVDQCWETKSNLIHCIPGLWTSNFTDIESNWFYLLDY